MTGLEKMTAMVEGRFPTPPIAKLLGMQLAEVREGETVFHFQAGPEHANPMGTLHGGVLCDLGDAAMGCAVATTLSEGQSFTTVELKTNFFKPVWNQRLTAVGTVVRRTRKLRYTEATIIDEKGSLVAKLNSSCLVLEAADAAGR